MKKNFLLNLPEKEKISNIKVIKQAEMNFSVS